MKSKPKFYKFITKKDYKRMKLNDLLFETRKHSELYNNLLKEAKRNVYYPISEEGFRDAYQEFYFMNVGLSVKGFKGCIWRGLAKEKCRRSDVFRCYICDKKMGLSHAD